MSMKPASLTTRRLRPALLGTALAVLLAVHAPGTPAAESSAASVQQLRPSMGAAAPTAVAAALRPCTSA